MKVKLTISLSYLLILISTLAYGQKRKTLADFETEYLERVYIKEEDRLNMIPFVNASSVKLYNCMPLKDIPEEVSHPFSYDTLVNTWIETAWDSIELNNSNIIELSEILLNSMNAEYAYRYAEEHYINYLEYIRTNKTGGDFSAGYVHGRTWDVPPSIFITQPSHLFVFYDQNKKLINYIGLKLKVDNIPKFSKSRLDSVNALVLNQVEYYIENKLQPKQTRQQKL